ncbi:MAG: hypothetical protein ABI947_08155 [Chloroflexota bacterium]
MAIHHPAQEIQQQMHETKPPTQGAFPMARWSSLLSGLVLGAKALREGGISGAILGFFSQMLLNRGTHKVELDRVPSPSRNPWWKRFTRQQATIAKNQPLVKDQQPPQNVTRID